MKFKGFWNSLWELNKQSLAWLKDYWFAYTILLVVGTTLYFLPRLTYAYLNAREATKKSDEDLDDFLC